MVQSSKDKRKRLIAFAVLGTAVWCVIAALIMHGFPGFCETINLKFYDWKLKLNPPQDPTRDIVHLDVDDDAIQQYGQWPWDRSMSAAIVRRLTEFGAKAIVFDVIYTVKGKSKEGDEEFFSAIDKAGNVVSATGVGLSDKPVGIDEEEKSKYALEVGRDRSRGDKLYDRSWVLNLPRKFTPYKVVKLSDAQVPLTPIITASKETGHIKALKDPDGSHRAVPLVIRLEDRYIPCLSLATLVAVWGLNPERHISMRSSDEIQIARQDQVIKIPVDPHGLMLVRWGDAWDTFKHYSVKDVLSGEPDDARPTRYKNKVVVIGFTATGSTDIGVTPGKDSTPLSRIHSFSLSTILSHEFITRVAAWPGVVVFSVVVAFLFSVVAVLLRLKLGSAVAVCVFVGYPLFSYLWFAYQSCDIPFMEFWLIFFPAALIALVIRGGTMELQGSRASRALERYLSPELLENILDHADGLDLRTKRRELTVLFVDIKGFSTVCETVQVEYINQFLNDFMERMASAIFEYRGTVDKFLGDGLLAFFGDPVPLENHALAAVKAAIKMQQEMQRFSDKWAKSGIAEFSQGTRIRIGINTGLLVVGNIGFARRMEYTVVGASVNVASRLQAIAPPGGIMMTARTRALAGNDIPYEGPAKVRVKGIDRDIEVYCIQPEAISQLSTET